MGKIVIKEGKTGFRFNVKAGNGAVVATSEIYKTEDACRKGAQSVAKNAPIAALEDQTKAGFATEKNPKFEVYLDKAGEYRFRLKAGNGEIILVGESYKAHASCMNGIASVRRNSQGELVKE